MSAIGSSSCCGGLWRTFECREAVAQEPNHTDGKIKAPTFGRAHVVGWIEDFRRIADTAPAGASAAIVNDFNAPSAVAVPDERVRP